MAGKGLERAGKPLEGPSDGTDLSRADETAGAASPLRVPPWVARTTYVAVPLATAVALVLHTFKVSGTRVDTTTVALLALLLIVPLAPYIRRLSAGGVEAEIGVDEAQQLRASAAELPAPIGAAAEVQDDPLSVDELIRRDPPLGLAKLRIDLERELREIYVRTYPEGARRGLSLGLMTRELSQRGELAPEIAGPLGEFSALANRAVHGEYVASDVAEEIAGVGLRVLAALRDMNARAG